MKKSLRKMTNQNHNTMRLPKSWTTVTPFSKTIALILFTMLPIVTFLLGMQYEVALSVQNEQTTPPFVQVVRTITSIPTPTPPVSVVPPRYTCPQAEYVDCTPLFLQWAQKNCPGFKGAAL